MFINANLAATGARSFFPGMGQAVADRTVARKKQDGTREEWAEVAARVALGSSLLHIDEGEREQERAKLEHHLRRATILGSGRHLQHGDEEQPTRPMEVFTNCSTSIPQFISYRLLLNGSGVGGDYSEAIRPTDYRKAPRIVPVLDPEHPDVASGHAAGYMSPRSVRHMYHNKEIVWFDVPDSREGWSQCFQKFEVMAWEGTHHNKVYVCDFSKVRAHGSPIRGMQNRPASGPGLMMKALTMVQSVCDSNMEPWEQAVFVDHYLAECVVVGGARRAARMATKSWRDKSVLRFIEIKRPIEFHGKTGEEILQMRKDRAEAGLSPYQSFLWTANNSVTLDAECWAGYDRVKSFLADKSNDDTDLGHAVDEGALTDMQVHAYRVLSRIMFCQYYDGTGEPGVINVDKLNQNRRGLSDYHDGRYVALGAEFDEATGTYLAALFRSASKLPYIMITNPCGEIALSIFGGYCVIADVVPYFAANDDEAEDAFRTTVRMLIRTNAMNCMYDRETKRTNRIGVGITGLHEYAFARFGYGWRDIIDEEKSKDFWMTLARFKRAVVDESFTYSRKMHMAVPVTNTTMKPAGTTSKLFGLTEGAHLPGRRSFMRWVQFRVGDPLIEDYKARGYPVRELKSYSGTVIVGFPTRMVICQLGMGDKLVTASEATPEEQYQYIRLLEKYWMRGVDKDGVPLTDDTGNQISYTLKYDPSSLDFGHYSDLFSRNQRTVKVCSVMPQEKGASSYEYLPEEPISDEEYEALITRINGHARTEEVDRVHVDCDGGACPVDFAART